MSLALTIIHASRASSTHHKLALDALAHLRGPDAARWRDLFLVENAVYLQGAKAPDKDFKDFANHVYHVSDNGWGGAPDAARRWKDRAVEAFAAGAWSQGVYAAGVMSHYFVDPIQPFHTGQTEAEGAVHRAAEWSFCKSYDELVSILETEIGGYPDMEPAEGEDWIEKMVKEGAAYSHPHYDVVIDHYDLARGKKRPTEGLDQEIKDRIARLVGYATIGLARVLEKLFAEAAARPPKVNAAPAALLAGLDMPRQWVLRKISDVGERLAVEAMYRELEATGRVVRRLPEDDAEVRNLHAREVLGVSTDDLLRKPARRPGRMHGVGAPPRTRHPLTGSVEVGRARLDPTYPRAPVSAKAAKADREAGAAALRGPRFHLSDDSPVVDAPSIGPKTAERLVAIDIHTVADLLALDPVLAAERLDVRHITPGLIAEWQDQARLVARVPELRGHDAQILVGCGVSSAEALAGSDLARLVQRTMDFCDTPQGKRVLRDMAPPDREEITRWIEHAQHARSFEAA